jgi:hypothetical protein
VVDSTETAFHSRVFATTFLSLSVEGSHGGPTKRERGGERPFPLSKLLIDEEPLIVIPSLAAQIGLNEALVLQQLHYWLKRSKHEHDERKWVYNTLGEWQAQFPFWSEDVLHRTMKSLVKQGLVVVHKFNKANWDRTNWYSINYEILQVYENRSVEILAKAEEKKLSIAAKRRDRSRKFASSKTQKSDALLYTEN